MYLGRSSVFQPVTLYNGSTRLLQYRKSISQHGHYYLELPLQNQQPHIVPDLRHRHYICNSP
ncbi:hypothetical protein ES332_D04G002900v1 [Gossypium tomentosum]|uniref:Uncharacterized protein n=1 Tax=Gossypium tomentosum TaxID=34277 RepID=A0A5D2L808_GOSTO|nr:hypothetical protein ES332_D04G002900v1 [Gossypium tomentosum]